MSKRRRLHGNLIEENNAPHHLYEIRDVQENDVFKYGISQDPIEEDGLSKRLRDQINLFNVVAGFIRFFARILVRNIPSRKEAIGMEKKQIKEYKEKNGKKPRGNRKYKLD